MSSGGDASGRPAPDLAPSGAGTASAAGAAVKSRRFIDIDHEDAPRGGAGECVLRALQWQHGPMRGRIDEVVLREATMVSGPHGLRRLAAAAVEVRGLSLSSTLRPTALPRGSWRLDALRQLDGALRAFITDAAWIVDADATLPIQHGRLNFDNVSVEHVGPDSSLGLSRGGVYLDAPHLGRRYLYVFTAGEVPGVSFEQRVDGQAGIGYRGAIDLHAFLPRLLTAGARPLGHPADPSVLGMLDRTRLAGDLQCGDGLLSVPGVRMMLSGMAAGRNRVGVSSAVLSRELVLRLPDVQADDVQLDLPQGWLSAARLSAEVELSLTAIGRREGEAPLAWDLQLRVARASLQQLTLALEHTAEPDRATGPARARSA